MNPGDALELLTGSFWVTLVVAGPIIVVATSVGVVVAVLQAVVQVQEMTLTFAPKMAAVLLLLLALAPYFGKQMTSFGENIIARIEAVP